MEINIRNAFKVAVNLSIGPCLEKYRLLTEQFQIVCLQMINFFLKRPILTTSLLSIFMVLIIIALATAFLIIFGVLAFIIIILLIEGIIFIVFAVVLSMSMATVALIVMTFTVGIKYNLSLISDME